MVAETDEDSLDDKRAWNRGRIDPLLLLVQDLQGLNSRLLPEDREALRVTSERNGHESPYELTSKLEICQHELDGEVSEHGEWAIRTLCVRRYRSLCRRPGPSGADSARRA